MRRETLWINKLTADLKNCPMLKSHSSDKALFTCAFDRGALNFCHGVGFFLASQSTNLNAFVIAGDEFVESC